jgi:hypothetical protein
MTQNDTHRQLLQLVHAYVRLNLNIEEKATFQKYIELRQLLSEIRRVATVRRAEVLEKAKDRREKKSQRQADQDDND